MVFRMPLKQVNIPNKKSQIPKFTDALFLRLTIHKYLK